MAPRDEAMLVNMLRTAIAHDGPIAFRYPRGSAEGVPIPETRREIEIGAGEILERGERVALLGYGWGVQVANDAAALLSDHDITPTVADARFAKPLDEEMILKLAREHDVLLTLEEGSVGGFGSHVLHLLADRGALDDGLKVRSIVLPDEYTDHDKPDRQYSAAGLDAKGIVAKVFEVLQQKTPRAAVIKGRA